ncbi:MAG: protoheme IX farnesyltransferase [Gloeomargaritaceae cyanobacterium C42_A2020_066]|nr:protoheme IX farnesyltransferase [Gloeomargaritaceae cyanobacterium C42_A2020_066]
MQLQSHLGQMDNSGLLRAKQVLQDYVQLTKPRIILLLLITTAGGLWLAADGHPAPITVVITLLTGTLAAGAANTINCLYDQDIDRVMVRTQQRPIPAGRIQPRHAFAFALSLAVSALLLQGLWVNWLSAGLEWVGLGIYVGVYTFWLKRSSPQNIVIGGAAGAIPPLVGWAAITGDLGWPAWVLFALICIWTPPHFWALALLIREDYAQVGVPMLPVVEGETVTARQILIYTLILVPLSLVLVFPCQAAGLFYGMAALVLGSVFLARAWHLCQAPGDQQRARTVFKYSILYLMLLCAALAVDHAIPSPVFDPLFASLSAGRPLP